MKSYSVVVSRMIGAPPESVYAVISDMEEHRKILPKEFESLVVVSGGRGAGTVVDITMRVMGRVFANRLTVLEPEPGRVMQEVDQAAGIETTWRLEPADEGRACKLTLASQFRIKPGFAGLMERLINPFITRSIYSRELSLLNAYVASK